MKSVITIAALCLLFCFNGVASAFVVDHNSTNLGSIPAAAINQAKSTLHIAYGHTSHGSQLITGMTGLDGQSSLVGYKGDIYQWNDGGSGGALDIDDGFVGGDLGHNGSTVWADSTRNYLDNPANSDVNVVIWSWCGGASDNTPAGIQIYLDTMNQLEIDYPDVTFVYMTGHADIYRDSVLRANNAQIRNYCIANNKVLYDFFDIERYNPDGQFFEYVSDGCNYYSSSGSSGLLGNWATEWQDSHTEGTHWYQCTSAHSEPLNANRKAYAAWWLWARIAGWNGGSGGDAEAPTVPQNLNATANSDSQISLSWNASTDNVAVTGYRVYRDGSEIATTATTAYNDTGLAASSTYAYTVVAYDATGNTSNPSDPDSATTQPPAADTEDPTIPQDLNASASSHSQINLSWSVSSDNVAVTGYKIYRGGTEIATTATTTYSDTGLAASSTHTYTVSAYDAADNESNQSDSASATTEPPSGDTEDPTVPLNLTATALSPTRIQLSWNASTDNVAVTGYRVFQDGSEIDTSTSTNYSNTGLTASSTYTYTVLAYDAAGNTSNQSSSASATTHPTAADTEDPTVPQDLNAAASSHSQINLSWSASTDNVAVTGYRVFQDGSEIATTTATTYNNTGLVASSTHTYTVLAYDAAGNESDYSNSESATTHPPAADTEAPTIPQDLNVSVISENEVALSWFDASDNTAVTGYKVYYKQGDMCSPLDGTGATEGSSPIDVGDVINTSVSGLNRDTPYYFAVTAYDAAGNESQYSNTVSNQWMPELQEPNNRAVNVSAPVTFRWSDDAVQMNVTYTLYYSTDPAAELGAMLIPSGGGTPSSWDGTIPVAATLFALSLLLLWSAPKTRIRYRYASLTLGAALVLTACGGGSGGSSSGGGHSAATVSSFNEGASNYHETGSGTNPELTAGTTYYWRVIATNNTDSSVRYTSETYSFTTEN